MPSNCCHVCKQLLRVWDCKQQKRQNKKNSAPPPVDSALPMLPCHSRMMGIKVRVKIPQVDMIRVRVKVNSLMFQNPLLTVVSALTPHIPKKVRAKEKARKPKTIPLLQQNLKVRVKGKPSHISLSLKVGMSYHLTLLCLHMEPFMFVKN